MSNHPAFELLREQEIPSLNVRYQEYRHRVTGAQHIHLAADNKENVFLVALRTVPMDSTGVAHILEHTALCGSEKYPVRDPFFMMIRRSLNTFMNAFTSSDWTAYPFASQNKKDFNNLLSVYLDSVFFARLDPLDFSQEGHRLEFSDPADSSSELTYKGVVFNEMKGAMSSINSTLWQTMSKHLYPTSTYHYNSGGEPADIPDLTYDQFQAFYRTHYHPSNATFITFGDIPAAEHQAIFEQNALSRFEKLDCHIAVSDEQRYSAPQYFEESYAADEQEPLENHTHIVLSWLLGNSTDLEATMQARLLASVLLDNSGSPLQKALETTGLGTSPSPMCGLEDSQKELCFACGVEGSNPEQADAVEAMILDVLRDVADNITQASLRRVIDILITDLKTKFGLSSPSILVCGLNPHAGEGGHLGREEIEVIEPVLAEFRRQGANLIGPLPADTLFTAKYLDTADAVLAMYHDQGLPVLKHQGFGRAANITLGLPIIRTSVDHGTALDLAGTGSADSGSLQTAIQVAADMAVSTTSTD